MKPVYALNALCRSPRALGSLSGVMMKDSYSCVLLARLSPRLFAQAWFSFFWASDGTIGLDLGLENCFDFAIAVAIGYQPPAMNYGAASSPLFCGRRRRVEFPPRGGATAFISPRVKPADQRPRRRTRAEIF